MFGTRIFRFAIGMAAAASAPMALAQSVNSFTVVNADTGADIATFAAAGAVSISTYPRINVRANTAGAASVVFGGSAGARTESTQPFSFKGDANGVYSAWSPAPGTVTISATPYSASGGGGTAGPTKTLSLTVTNSTALVPAVNSFTIVNADTGVEISTTTNSTSVSLASTPRISVRANTTNAASLVFRESTGTFVDSSQPFALRGDSGGVYTPWAPTVGTYTIGATPYSGLNAAGTAGTPATLQLSVVSGNTAAGGTGKLMVDPNNPRAFVYDRDADGDGQRDTAYIAGSGGPEGFLYESSARQDLIASRLIRSTAMNTSVNGLYFHSVRAFGGDGGSAETPFVDNANPNSGLDPVKMSRWRNILQRLDSAGVVLWFNLFDDHSLPFGCTVTDATRTFVKAMVEQFRDLKHLIWVTQEEFNWTDRCTAAQNAQRQRDLAAAIRLSDPVHPVATHHMGGQDMQFGGDVNIGVFGQQTTVTSPAAMHDSAGAKGWGNWVYVMAEAHPWHMNLIDQELSSGTGRAPMRLSHWATALSGGHVFMYNAFECGNAARLCNGGATDSDPTDDMLDDLRRLKLFMEAAPFNRLVPMFGTELANARMDSTRYILANAPAGLYVLYGDAVGAKLGVRGAPAGSYSLKWFDPVTGFSVVQSATVGVDGVASFTKPGGIGAEAALLVRKQ